jgi:hypothetical protein
MSVHATFTADPDKAVCGVRISHKLGRQAAKTPADLTCDRCVLLVLRTWQRDIPDYDPVKFKETPWPSGVGGVP